jgi:archaellum biogenesis ATPase FlaH
MRKGGVQAVIDRIVGISQRADITSMNRAVQLITTNPRTISKEVWYILIEVVTFYLKDYYRNIGSQLVEIICMDRKIERYRNSIDCSGKIAWI